MGSRRSACIQLEKAFAVGFQAYFVGDPCFVKPPFRQQDTNGFFVAAQSVSRLYKPQVCFLCLEATEEVAYSAVYTGKLKIIIDSVLSERDDDYPSLDKLHGERVAKVLNLLGNITLLQTLMNAPASGPDNRAVTQFQLYGIATIDGEQNKPEDNQLCTIIPVDVGFQPIGP